MPKFKLHVQRVQVQSQFFCIESSSQEELEQKLCKFDFGKIDYVFDEGEVDSINYEVVETKPCEYFSAFASEDLQQCLNFL
jgi:hypothetical protein